MPSHDIRTEWAGFDMRASWRLGISAISQVLIGGILISCADTLVSADAIRLAGSVEHLYVEQALENFGNFISAPRTMPSQVDFSAGTAQTTYGTTLGLSIPYGNNVVRGTAGTVTAITAPYQAILPSTNLNRMQGWTMNPVNDRVRLGNLAALYRYVVTGEESALRADYHFPTRGTEKGTQIDPYFLLEPQCILCLNPQTEIGALNLDARCESTLIQNAYYRPYETPKRWRRSLAVFRWRK
jgi:hypothetical protein